MQLGNVYPMSAPNWLLKAMLMYACTFSTFREHELEAPINNPFPFPKVPYSTIVEVIVEALTDKLLPSFPPITNPALPAQLFHC